MIKRFENDTWVDLTPALLGLTPAEALGVQWEVGADGDHLLALRAEFQGWLLSNVPFG